MLEDPLRKYYGARAPEYDKVYLKPERQADLREIEHWLSTIFSGYSVLEVACGTGYWTQFIASSAAYITALDATQETLDIAQVRVSSENAQFHLGDAYAIHLSERRFGAGFAGFWISHVPKSRLREFLEGFHGALAPGAKVVLLDNRFVAASSTPVSRQDAEGNTYQIRPLEDGSNHEILKNFWSPEDMLIATNGLVENLRFHEWEYFWAAEYQVKASNE